jgi:hypothetical protein
VGGRAGIAPRPKRAQGARLNGRSPRYTRTEVSPIRPSRNEGTPCDNGRETPRNSQSSERTRRAESFSGGVQLSRPCNPFRRVSVTMCSCRVHVGERVELSTANVQLPRPCNGRVDLPGRAQPSHPRGDPPPALAARTSGPATVRQENSWLGSRSALEALSTPLRPFARQRVNGTPIRAPAVTVQLRIANVSLRRSSAGRWAHSPA